ncbi:MAG TPA: DUF2505 family protein [Acidimicrobiales bacterium]|nr:DUF2505 family protein [Acidimicrobiales bacterium]
MRFSAEHRFAGTPAQVAAALGDPDFYLTLDLPDLRLLEVHEVDRSAPSGGTEPVPGVTGAETGLELRYEFTGALDPVALRLLGGTRPTWTQEVRLREDAGGRLRFAAEANPRLLHGAAAFSLEREGEGTVRRLDGELVVALPVVGGMAERRIVPGVLRRLDVEAEAVRERFSSS